MRQFEALYTKYEQEGKARRTIKAQELWFAVVEAQTETGTPYILYKDACNRKSNQQNLGTIKCSNLCTEIVEYTSPEEVAVCNLASIGLPVFVDNREFDHERLRDSLRRAVENQPENAAEEGEAVKHRSAKEPVRTATEKRRASRDGACKEKRPDIGPECIEPDW